MKLLDSTELAIELGVPLRTLDQWAYTKTGPKTIKIGRHRRYRREDVDAWLEVKSRGGAA